MTRRSLTTLALVGAGAYLAANLLAFLVYLAMLIALGGQA